MGGGSGVGGGATSGGEPTGVASVAAVGASAATAGRRAGAPGGRLRTLPYTNPAIASTAITTAVVIDERLHRQRGRADLLDVDRRGDTA